MTRLTDIRLKIGDKLVSPELQSSATMALEQGQVLFMPNGSFPLLPHENPLILAATTYINSKSKNISFDSNTGLLRGVQCATESREQLKTLLVRFSEYARTLLNQLIPYYTSALQQGRTSFRPIEIFGRVSRSYRKDDTRLHIDAFPATPNQGRRILRVFSNINPAMQDRLWRLGEPFVDVANQFFPRISAPFWGSAAVLQTLGITKGLRTAYDHAMLQIHDRMKGDKAYQSTVSYDEIRFPAGSSWIVQTDHVSHAAIAGQHVLEQTFYLPVSAMQNPAHSPLRILEQLAGKKLV